MIDHILKWVIIVAVLFIAIVVRADDFTDEQIVNAIFKAEGSLKATYLYGIRSVYYEDEAEARRICFNTVRNHRKRHAKHDCGKEYLVCLRDRYCPLQAKNDPKGLNSYWLKNVRYFLNSDDKIKLDKQ